VEAKAQLERLLRIQELALGIRAAQKVVEEAPTRIEEIEAHFRERNAEYVAVKAQLDDVELDQKTRTGELAHLEEQRDKYKAGMLEVKNQREYAAMLKEIDSVNDQIAGNEEAILKDMEALEKLRGEMTTHEAHIKTEREVVARDRSEVEAAAKTADVSCRELTTERDSLEKDLPHSLRAAIEKLELRRQGVFLSQAENGTCMSCFVRIRPQMFQEIKLAKKVHTCGNCRRYLYFQPAAEATETSATPKDAPASSASEGGASDSGGSEAQAVNGGAV
jgi:predicted  nucleic acid-binding Zn-ribbon protein